MGTESRQTPLRVAVIGTGFGSRVQLPGFLSQSETYVVALCGTQDEKTKAIAQQYGVRAVYTDYEQMLVDVEPDLVSVTAPPRLHNAMTVAALEAGAHVLCEKPLAMSVEEGEEMLHEAETRGLVHAVDFEFRYLPARYYQRVLADQGYIGEPVLIEASYYKPALGQRLWSWWMDHEQGGGILGAIGSHAIDAFRWLTGREVVAVTATLSTSPIYRARALPDGSGERPVTSDDTAVLALELQGGLRGIITLSAVASGEAQRLALHGTEGALVVQDDLELWGRRGSNPLALIDVPPEYEPPVWVPEENLLLGPFVKLAGMVADAILGRSIVPPPSFHDGLAVQRVLETAYRSSAQGCRLVVPPQ